VDELLGYPEMQAVLLGVMREIEAVGRARGVALDRDVVERTMAYIEGSAPYLQASMHKDLEEGNPMELEALNGAVVRLGRELGVPTPINDLIYAFLKPHDLRARHP
jgi:2-dehydropantoate 2-reductase